MECIICWDDNGCHKLGCNHYIHLQCATQLFSLNCPLCQQEMNNLPDDCKEQINKNTIARQQELDNEDREAAEAFNRFNIDLEQVLGSTFRTPQIELMLAVSALRQMGIPLRFIPNELNIELGLNDPVPIPGFITGSIGNEVMERIQHEIGDFEDDSDTIDDGISDDEDVFREDDMINSMRMLPRANIIRK